MKCESQRFSCKKSIIFTFIELMKACEPSMNLLQHNSGTYHEHIISFDFRVLVVLSCHLKATSKKYRYVQQKVLMCDFFYTAVCLGSPELNPVTKTITVKTTMSSFHKQTHNRSRNRSFSSMSGQSRPIVD